VAKGLDVLGDEVIRMFVEHVSPQLLAEVERSVNEVRARAEAEWPIGKRRWPSEQGKPHSRDLFASVVEIRRKGVEYEIVGTIRNSANYFKMIVPLKLAGQTGRSRVAFVYWMWDPLKAHRERIRAALPKVVARG
jgi:hypothetical protein